MHSVSHAHCLAVDQCHFVVVLPSKLWTGCSLPAAPHPASRPTQLPLATDSQCSVRRGLSPRCWCALSGALGATFSMGFLQVRRSRSGRPPSLSRPLLTLGNSPHSGA